MPIWIDWSVSESYSDVSYELETSSSRLAGILEREWNGMTKDEVLRRMKTYVSRSDDRSGVVFEDEEDDSIRLGIIIFEFEEDRLAAVRVWP